MKKQLLLAGSMMLACCTASVHAQSAHPLFDTAPGLLLPRDSATMHLLFSALNGFLQQKDGPARENGYIWQPELAATSALTDELKGIERNEAAKTDHFYTGYLTNIIPMPDNKYQLQLSYLGSQAAQPLLKASVRLMAIKTAEGFRFYAPLKQQTQGWQQQEAGNITFYYKDKIDTVKMRSYQQYSDLFETKLGIGSHRTHLYCCSGLSEALQLAGIDYQSDYNGNNYGSLSAHEGSTSVIINGTLKPDFRNFDPHDFWHAKLRMVLPAEKVNKPVDEGCAFLYGGSWGMSWEQIADSFRLYRKQQKNPDWLQLYLAGTDFKEGKEPLKISYFLNALIVQQLEKEKGFAAVKELLACGPKEKGDENYFKTLEALTGITKSNFNTRIKTLLQPL